VSGLVSEDLVYESCAPKFAAGPRCQVGAAVFVLYRAQVRGPSGHARVLPRRDGVMQAVVGTWARAVKLSGFVGAAPFELLHSVRFVDILCRFGVVVPRWKRCACVACPNLCVCLAGTCRTLTRLVFVHVHCAPGVAAGPRFHVGTAVLAPYHAQVRGPSGLTRVLPRRDGIEQAVEGACSLAVELSDNVGAAPFASLQGS